MTVENRRYPAGTVIRAPLGKLRVVATWVRQGVARPADADTALAVELYEAIRELDAAAVDQGA
jgi:hypothetical protein